MRAAVGGAVHGVVNPLVPPEGAQDAVLDLVEGQVLAGDPGVHVVPRPRIGDHALVEVADRVHRIGVEHDLDRQRVVEVDPVGHLLRAGVAAGIEPLEAVEIGGQPGRGAGVGRQRLVVDEVDARLVGGDVGVQDVLPGAVVDALGAGFVAGVPGRDRLRRRRAAGGGQQQRAEHGRGGPAATLPEAQADDRAEDPDAGADDAAERAPDLRAAGTPPQGVDGNLADAQTPPDRLDLHLDGPAVGGVAHVEGPQGGGSDGPEGPEVGHPSAPEQANQDRGHAVAGDLRRRQRARLPASGHAGADHEVGAGRGGPQQVPGLLRPARPVAVHEQDHVHGPQRAERGQTRAAVAGNVLGHHARARLARPLRRGVGGPVVADHEVVHDARPAVRAQPHQPPDHAADGARFVAGGNHDADGQALVHDRPSATGVSPAAAARPGSSGPASRPPAWASATTRPPSAATSRSASAAPA